MRNGTRECPWNIYRMDYSKFLKKDVPTHVGYGETLKGCKASIDAGCCIDEVR